MNKIKWHNIPIPPQHILLLVVGLILNTYYPQQLLASAIWVIGLGLPLLIAGFVLSFWATVAVSDINVEKPTQIISTGPYSISRNPMYVAWAFIYLGISFWTNNLWDIIFVPLLLIFTHFYDVLKEERYLRKQFGEEFEKYSRHVRRYF